MTLEREAPLGDVIDQRTLVDPDETTVEPLDELPAEADPADAADQRRPVPRERPFRG